MTGTDPYALKFVYVTYIATTQDKLWEALTDPEFTQRYWFGVRQEFEPKVGASWLLRMPSGEIWDSGQVLEIDPPTRYVVSWKHEHFEDMRTMGPTRASFLLEPYGEVVKLTVTHEVPAGGEAFLDGVSGGWPKILASLKSLLETGKPLPESAHEKR